MTEPLNILSRVNRSKDTIDDDLDVYADSDDYRAFGYSRKPVSSDPMINFIDSTGTQTAFAYGHLYQTKYDPSEGIVIEFTEHVVSIRGRRLGEAFAKLVSQRVVFVAEADRPTAVLVPDDLPVVTRLEIADKKERPSPR
ncbi:hypothetical protein [Rhodopirellula baltica]